jgi:hypothetical protein
MLRALIAGLALTVSLALGASAQELPKAKKFDNVRWYGILSVEFKPDKLEQGSDIVYKHFAPAGEAAGMREVRVLQPIGGKWDMLVFFPMQGGPADLEWEVSPQDEKFWAALAGREGGSDKAFEIFGKYMESIADSDYQIAFERQEPQGETASAR